MQLQGTSRERQAQILQPLGQQQVNALAFASLQQLESQRGMAMDAAAGRSSSSVPQQWQRSLGSADPLCRVRATLDQHIPRHTAQQLSHPSQHPSAPPGRTAACVYGTDAAQRMLWIAEHCLGRLYYGGQTPAAMQTWLLLVFSIAIKRFQQRESVLRKAQPQRPHQRGLGLARSPPLPTSAPWEQAPSNCHAEHAASQPVAPAYAGGFLHPRRIAPMPK